METQDKILNQRHSIKLRIDSNLKIKLDETASRLCLSRNAIILLLIDEGLRNSKFIVTSSGPREL
jgi:predicted transcriptional regulator